MSQIYEIEYSHVNRLKATPVVNILVNSDGEAVSDDAAKARLFPCSFLHFSGRMMMICLTFPLGRTLSEAMLIMRSACLLEQLIA